MQSIFLLNQVGFNKHSCLPGSLADERNNKESAIFVRVALYLLFNKISKFERKIEDFEKELSTLTTKKRFYLIF